MKQIIKTIRYKLKDDEGIGTVEIILILVVLIALVLVFKDQILALAGNIFNQINRSVRGVY